MIRQNTDTSRLHDAPAVGNRLIREDRWSDAMRQATHVPSRTTEQRMFEGFKPRWWGNDAVADAMSRF